MAVPIKCIASDFIMGKIFKGKNFQASASVRVVCLYRAETLLAPEVGPNHAGRGSHCDFTPKNRPFT